MSNAWEITEDDVAIILRNHGSKKSITEAHDIVCEQRDRVEKAALMSDEMEDQTYNAYEEMEKILKEEGYLNE